METKSLDGVWVETLVRVSNCGVAKRCTKKGPARCAIVLDGVEGLKDHYWLKGGTIYGKGDKIWVRMKLRWVEGYGIRVKEWEYL